MPEFKILKQKTERGLINLETGAARWLDCSNVRFSATPDDASGDIVIQFTITGGEPSIPIPLGEMVKENDMPFTNVEDLSRYLACP